uniref:Uncharacterized protein n=1 Tax=Cucumis melo TaxID=3656 RepID=A0A9I9E1T4_CUCME
MELFPAQPDLSLQISPPNSSTNSKPSSNSNWRTQPISSISPQHPLDLMFWNHNNNNNINKSFPSNNSSSNSSNFDPSLSNSSNFLSHHFPPTVNGGGAGLFPPPSPRSSPSRAWILETHQRNSSLSKPSFLIHVFFLIFLSDIRREWWRWRWRW